MSLGRGANLHGFVPFPADNAWNQDISSAPVDPNSTTIINFIGGSTPLHPDFGAGLYAGRTIGIPYTVVSGAQLANIHFTAYGTESDPGPMPIPSTAPIEGYPNPGDGDRHVLVLDRDNCWLYELYGAYRRSDGGWNAASAAVWDLLHDEQRPYTWTSADAAVIIPTVNSATVTPHSEAFQAVIWHLLVSHPLLKARLEGIRRRGGGRALHRWTVSFASRRRKLPLGQPPTTTRRRK